MYMVCAPSMSSRKNLPVDATPVSQLQRNQSPAVNAYLQHLQSKKNGTGIDQRQTIAAPIARGRVSSRQQPLQQHPVGISDINAQQSINTKSALGNTLPRSSPANVTSTPRRHNQKHGSKSSGRSAKLATKPPLCSHQKHPRSIISEATNSTYLSSDSDEDASTATATVHSEGTSSFQSGPSTSGGGNNNHRRHRKGRPDDNGSGSSPRNFPEHHHTFNTDNAMVPYQPNDPYSSYTHDSVIDDDAYATDNNSGNYYFTDQNQRHQRSRSSSYYSNDGDHMKNRCHEDADEFSYSDEEDYQNNYHYPQQQQQRGKYQHYDHDQYENHTYYENNDEDNDALAVDLDQLIEEASARWKLSVSETVQRTVTTATFVSQQMSASATTPFISPVLQRQYSEITAGRVTVTAPVFSDLVKEHHVPNQTGTFPDNVLPAASSSQLIHEQQSEIEALRAELQRHHQQQVSQPHVTVMDPHASPLLYPPPHHQQQQQQQQQPVHPIQVLTVATDHSCTFEDDLTVWSGFQSMSAPPPVQQRPDADVSSVTGENHITRPNQPHARATRVPLPPPPRPPSSTVRLELSSIVTGVTRSAIFTGTVTSRCLPTSDNFTTLTNHSLTGNGVLQFIETGDVYRGDIVHSEMHGYGTYTFGESDRHQVKVLSGQFKHNVFIGE